MERLQQQLMLLDQHEYSRRHQLKLTTKTNPTPSLEFNHNSVDVSSKFERFSFSPRASRRAKPSAEEEEGGQLPSTSVEVHTSSSKK